MRRFLYKGMRYYPIKILNKIPASEINNILKENFNTDDPYTNYKLKSHGASFKTNKDVIKIVEWMLSLLPIVNNPPLSL